MFSAWLNARQNSKSFSKSPGPELSEYMVLVSGPLIFARLDFREQCEIVETTAALTSSTFLNRIKKLKFLNEWLQKLKFLKWQTLWKTQNILVLDFIHCCPESFYSILHFLHWSINTVTLYFFKNKGQSKLDNSNILLAEWFQCFSVLVKQ